MERSHPSVQLVSSALSQSLKRSLDLSDDTHSSAAGFKNEWVKTYIRPDALRVLTAKSSLPSAPFKHSC